MKELYQDIRLILHECLSVFSRNPMTGQRCFGILDALGYLSMPILIFIWTFWTDFLIEESLNEAIIGILSIFVVLAFQVIYMATDKFAARVVQIVKNRQEGNGNNLFEDEKNYLTRLRNYSLQFVRQLILLLLLSLFIILCSTLMLCFRLHFVLISLSAIILSSFYIWLLLLLMMIVNIYKLLKDDIGQHYKMVTNQDGNDK